MLFGSHVLILRCAPRNLFKEGERYDVSVVSAPCLTLNCIGSNLDSAVRCVILGKWLNLSVPPIKCWKD